MLDGADEVILLPVYPARELPIPGVTSEMITNKMTTKNKRLMSKTELLDWIKNEFTGRQGCVLITAGAGDIDGMVGLIRKVLESGC